MSIVLLEHTLLLVLQRVLNVFLELLIWTVVRQQYVIHVLLEHTLLLVIQRVLNVMLELLTEIMIQPRNVSHVPVSRIHITMSMLIHTMM